MMENEHKFIAIVGMAGSGKTEAANYLKGQGLGYVRFGQLTLDEVMRRGWEINEGNERKVREEFRAKHGMAAYAILNLPKFEEALQKSHVIGDGLYSWEEYKFLREKLGSRMIVLAINASPETRYQRLENRVLSKEDTQAIYRQYTPEEARSRDYAELEKLRKGEPIAMADWTIVNEGTVEELRGNIEEFLGRFGIR